MDLSIMGLLCFIAVSSFSIHHYYVRRLGFRKIKKYLDNRENNFKTSFQKKFQNLEDASIHFDVDFKKYQQFSKIVSNELSQMEKKIFLFEEIDKKLNERIREYNEQKDEMDKMFKEITKEAGQFRENRNFIKDLDVSIQLAQGQITELIQVSKERMEENATQVQNDFLEKENLFKGKIDEFFEHESKNTSLFLKEQREKFEDEANGLTEQNQIMATQLEGLEGKLNSRIEEVLSGHIAQEVHNQIRNKARETFDEMDHWRKLIQTHVEPNKDAIKALPDTLVKIKQDLETEKNSLIHHIKEHKRAVVNAWEKERVERIKGLTESIDQKAKESLTHWESHLDAFQKQKQEDLDKVSSKIEHLREDAIKEFNELVHGQMEPQFHKLNHVKAVIEEQREQLDLLREETKQLSEHHKEQQEKVERDYQSLASRLDTQIQKDSQVALEKIKGILEEKNDELDKTFASYLKGAKEDQTSFRKFLQEKRNFLDEELKDSLKKSKQEQVTHYAKLSDKLDGSFKHSLESFNQNLEKKQTQIDRELKSLKELNLLKEQHSKSMEKIQASLREDQEQIEEIKKHLDGKTDEAYQDLLEFKERQKKKFLSIEEKSLKEFAQNIKRAENLEIKQNKKAIHQFLKESKKKLEKQHQGVLKKQESGLEKLYQNGNTQIEKLKQRLFKEFEGKSRQFVKQAESSVNQSMKELLKHLGEKEAAFQKRSLDLLDTFKEKEREAERELRTFEQQNLETKEDMREAQNTIWSYVKEAKNAIEEIKPILNARDGYVDDIRKKMEDAMAAVQNEEKAAWQEIKDRQRQYAKDLDLQIHGHEGQILQLRDNIKTAIDNKDKQFTHYHEELRKTREEAQKRFDRFLSDLQGEYQGFRDNKQSDYQALLKHQQAGHHQQAESLKKSFEDNVARFFQQEGDKSQNHLKKAKEKLDTIERLNRNVHDQVEGYETKIKEIDKRASDLLEGYQNQFGHYEKTVARFDKNLDKLLTSRHKDFDGFFENYISNSKGMLARFIDEKQNAIEEELKSLTELLHNQRENIAQMSELSRSDISENTQKVKKEALRRLEELEQLSHIEFNKTKSQFSQAIGEFESRLEAAENKSSSLIEEITSQVKKQDQLSIEYRKTLDKRQLELSRKVDAELSQTKRFFEAFMAQSELDMKMALEKFEKSSAQWSEKETDKLKGLTRDLSSEVAQAKAKSEAMLSKHIQEFRSEILSSDHHFADLRENFTKDIKESTSSFREDIEREMIRVKAEIGKLSVKKDKRFLQFEEAIEKELKRIKKQSQRLEAEWKKYWNSLKDRDLKKIDGALEGFKEKLLKTETVLKEKLNQFNAVQKDNHHFLKDIQGQYEDLYRENQKRLEELTRKGEGIHSHLKKHFAEKTQAFEERLKTKEKNLTKESEDNFNKLNEQFKLVMDKVDGFVSQTGVFKKVDLLRDKLTQDLNEYTEKIQTIKKDSKAFVAIEEKLNEIKKIEAESKQVLESIRSEKAELRQTEIKLEELQKLTDTLDKKIKSVDTTRKEIEGFHKNLDTYASGTQKLKKDVEGLIAYQKEIEKSLEMLSKLEKKSGELKQSYGSLDKRIDTSSEQQIRLDEHLSEIEEKSILIEASHKKILEFSKKYDALEIAVADVEERQKTMKKLRDELAVEKKNLTDLREDIQKQIKMALNFKNRSPKNDEKSADEDAFSPNQDALKKMAITLSDIGWTREQIAQHLKKELYENRFLPSKRNLI